MNTLILAAISGQSLIYFVIAVVVVALIFWLLNWLITYCGVPEPFNKVLRVVLAVFAVIFLINELLGLVGKRFISW